MVIVIFWKSRKQNLWEKIFALLIFVNIFLKLATFPAPAQTRFFTGYLLMLFIWLIYVWNKTDHFYKIKPESGKTFG